MTVPRRLSLCAMRLDNQLQDYTLLDAGCRAMDLKPLLQNCRKYYGADLTNAEGVLPCNLEHPLPFEDDSFDAVAALDVLEHLNDPHGAMSELLRIARQTVIISLPNMHYVSFRWNFLIGRGVSGKYHFPPLPVADRHRWILSYTEALKFVRWNAREHRIEHDMILPFRNRTRRVSEPVEAWLGARWPDLFAYGVLFQITLDGNRTR